MRAREMRCGAAWPPVSLARLSPTLPARCTAFLRPRRCRPAPPVDWTEFRGGDTERAERADAMHILNNDRLSMLSRLQDGPVLCATSAKS